MPFSEQVQFELTNPGFVDHVQDGLFTPELPESRDTLLPVGIIGPFSPVVQSGEVIVGYVDASTTPKKLFLITLFIQSNCP